MWTRTWTVGSLCSQKFPIPGVWRLWAAWPSALGVHVGDATLTAEPHSCKPLRKRESACGIVVELSPPTRQTRVQFSACAAFLNRFSVQNIFRNFRGLAILPRKWEFFAHYYTFLAQIFAFCTASGYPQSTARRLGAESQTASRS